MKCCCNGQNGQTASATDPNEELFNSVFQNAEMARDILGRLIRVCDNADFRGVMATEFIEYQEVITDVVHAMGKLGYTPKSNRLARTMSFSGIKVNTMINKTASHIAEMIIQGSAMGIIDTRRALNENAAAAPEVKALACRLIETERANIDGLMRFL